MQNALPFFEESLRAEGRAFLPADPTHQFALIDARDIGALSARLLALEDLELIHNRLHGKFLELHGPRLSSFQELVQTLQQQQQGSSSSTSGLASPAQDWKVVRVSGKQWMEKMRQYRPDCRQEVLEGVVQMFRIMTGEWPQAVDYTPKTSSVLKEFGVPQRTVENFARDYASHFLPNDSGSSVSGQQFSHSSFGTSGTVSADKGKGQLGAKDVGENFVGADTFSHVHST